MLEINTRIKVGVFSRFSIDTMFSLVKHFILYHIPGFLVKVLPKTENIEKKKAPNLDVPHSPIPNFPLADATAQFR